MHSTRKRLRDDFPGFVICPKVLIVQAVACCGIIAASIAKGFVRPRRRRLLWDVRPRTILKFGTRRGGSALWSLEMMMI